MQARIAGVSVWGPGLEGWAAARPILAGEAPHELRDSPPPPPAILAATERRRTGPVTRLALAVATEAAAGHDAATLRSIFGSSNGDGPVVGGILAALAAGGERVVSPTQFHNSVHNAAAGYWTIATGSHEPATCLGAHDDTWAASLMLAMAHVQEGRPVLLVCYDHPLPPPLAAKRPTPYPFALALVLEPGVGLAVGYHATPVPVPGAGLTRALPLLRAIAARRPYSERLPYQSAHLHIELA